MASDLKILRPIPGQGIQLRGSKSPACPATWSSPSRSAR